MFTPSFTLRHTLASAAVLLSSLAVVPTAFAQWTWYPAQHLDYSGAQNTAHQVENTGNDHVPLAGQTLRVMCWDGDQPGIGWSFSPDTTAGNTGAQPLLGTQFGHVTDPDVVADPGNFGARRSSSTEVLVAYLLDGAVAYEVLRYDASNNTLTNVSPAPVILADADEDVSNPNVDVNGNGQAVITWARHGAIMAQVYDIPSQTLYNRCGVAREDGYWLTQLDVATGVETAPQEGHHPVANTSFIYVASDRYGRQTVRMVQVSSYELKYNGSVNSGAGTDVLPRQDGLYDAPRIAGPVNWYSFGPCDFEAVVSDVHSNYIIGPNAYGTTGPVSPSSLPTTEVLNSYGNFYQQAVCRRPVVSYCFDQIEVCWTMTDDARRPVRNSSQEVVYMRMNWLGQSGNMNPPNAWYSIVNHDEQGDQSVPSVAGRYAAMVASGVTAYAFYCFYDEPSQDVRYKSSWYFSTSLRPAGTKSATAAGLSAYPNPVQGRTTLTLPAQVGAQSLEVYGPTGQLVYRQALATTGAQQVTWDASSLPAGLYLVRLHTSTGIVYTYRLQHE